MHKKNLTIFVLGVLISTVVMIFIYNRNKPTTTDSFYAKAEMFPKDDPFARIEYERKMLADPVTGEIQEDRN